MRLIVTRPAAQASAFVARLAALGIDAVAMPLIGIEPVADRGPIEHAWAGLPGSRLVMFVSANAVEHFFAARPPSAPWPAGVAAAATGPGTAAALESAGVSPADIVQPPDGGPYDSEALWARLAGGDWAGARVLVVRGEGGRDWFAERMRAAGARVDFVAAYRRVAPRLDAALASQARASPDTHRWHFSSSEAIDHLVQALPEADWQASSAFATHARIAERARRAGFGAVALVGVRADDVAAALQSPGRARPRR